MKKTLGDHEFLKKGDAAPGEESSCI